MSESGSGSKILGQEKGSGSGSMRAEIDTSAPFESVKEADMENIGIAKVEEQAALLEKDLFVKERETLEVLKELESTKAIVEELKLKLQQQAAEGNATLESSADARNETSNFDEEEKDNLENPKGGHQNLIGGLSPLPSSAPGLILLELKQAKVNLSRTTNDLADTRTSVELLNKKLEKERISLEKTRERLTTNSSKISSLEEELNQTREKLQRAKDAEMNGGSDNPVDISRELQRLSSEAEQFKKMGNAAKSEVLRTLSEIEQTKSRIKTAEIRLIAARKMKEAARAVEAVALAEIKALSSHENSSEKCSQKPEGVTLTFEEYSSLTCKAREAEELSKTKVVDAMLQVDEANVSNMEVLKKVEEATEEIKTSKKALEEALNRVEAANKGKLAVEEALRKWRSEHGQKRRSINNSAKFKNPHPSHHRRDSRLLDVNGLNLVSDGSVPVLKPTLSIGQILSRKLHLPEEFETQTMAENGTVKRKVSLGQMLGKQNVDVPPSWKADKENCQKQFSAKRKKFGFARFSLLLTKQSKKKKKPTPNLRLNSSPSCLISNKGIMDLRIGLLFLLALGAASSIAARQMAATEILSTTAETYEISVEIIENQEQENTIQTSNNVKRKDEVCTLCEEFASQALNYLAENKTQTEILEKLHRTCSRLTTLEQECITLVDYYSSIFFTYVSSAQSEDFCHKFNLCQEMLIFSAKRRDDSCGICQLAVSEVLVKLKDPDTQCKRMVFEYGPVILTNAEQFLETTDLCTMLHACKVPEDSIEALTVLKAGS
uniref:Saposin B-type domain-containing protein n=1 Tax=Salix viminalis TaxID=40686 RepID=A0A6N2K7L9_SALVM